MRRKRRVLDSVVKREVREKKRRTVSQLAAHVWDGHPAFGSETKSWRIQVSKVIKPEELRLARKNWGNFLAILGKLAHRSNMVIENRDEANKDLVIFTVRKERRADTAKSEVGVA